MSHEQAKRFLASPVGIRDMATGSQRAAIRVAWSACRAFLRLAASYGSSHCGGRHQSVLRQVVSPVATMQVHPATLPVVSQAAGTTTGPPARSLPPDT